MSLGNDDSFENLLERYKLSKFKFKFFIAL